MKIYKKEAMKNFTSFKIGGVADIIAEPKDIKELVELIKFLRNKGIIFYIIGNGTNVLVSDKGIRGCVVHLGKNLSKIKVNGTKIEAESGALLSEIAAIALKNKLQGFEQLSGIPGSIGGAVAMNAGAYDREIKDVVTSVNAINEQGRVVKLNRDALDFSYRRSAILEKNFIVTSVTINLQPGDKNKVLENMNKYAELRKSKQPLEWPSAGSTFKRPEGKYAALLIKDSNLMGECVGDAEISTKHAGFIINKGNAKASDVYKLMNIVKADVKTYFNVDLEPEIKLWGKF